MPFFGSGMGKEIERTYGQENEVKKTTTNSRYLRLSVMLNMRHRFQILHLCQENEEIVAIIADLGILMRCMTKHETVNQFLDCRFPIFVVSIAMGRATVLLYEPLEFLDEKFRLIACFAKLLNLFEGFGQVYRLTVANT